MSREPDASFRIVPAGDSALIVEFAERIDPIVNARTVAFADAIQAADIPGVRDVVPTFRSVAIYFDPLRTHYDQLVTALEAEAARPTADAGTRREPLRIPVCYGGDFGPDLPEVASFARMSETDVIRAHTAATYRVFMLGFVAGFAYMGIVDQRIAMPRRATPRLRVPLGTVGIAGVQTGIYPAETPGGWQLIGRTPIKPFDAERPDPFLVRAGDMVQFYTIDRDQYDRMEREAAMEREAVGADLGRPPGAEQAPPLRRDGAPSVSRSSPS